MADQIEIFLRSLKRLYIPDGGGCVRRLTRNARLTFARERVRRHESAGPTGDNDVADSQ